MRIQGHVARIAYIFGRDRGESNLLIFRQDQLGNRNIAQNSPLETITSSDRLGAFTIECFLDLQRRLAEFRGKNRIFGGSFGGNTEQGAPRRTPQARIRISNGSDRKSTRLNSSHLVISYAVFCLKQTH